MPGRKIAEGFVRLRPERDSGRFAREATPGMTRAGEHAGKTFGSSFAGAFLAVGAAGALAGFVRGAFEEAAAAAKIGRLTNAVIKSTGMVAHVTAAQVNEMADRLARVSAVDAHVIASSENVLLTFTRVRNELGKGNDVFNQGVQAALNLSAALGTDLQAATILVGKALNDPVGGLTALKKAGIQFTDVQKQMIRGMVEAGSVIGAQKIVLGELTTQFGGAAEAAASSAGKAKVAWHEFQREIGEQLIPVLSTVLQFGVKNQQWLTPMVTSVGELALVIGTAVVVSKTWAVVNSVLGVGLTGTAVKARRAALGLAAYLVIVQAINAAGRDLAPQLDELGERLAEFGKTGRASGELARVMGDDLDKLTLAFRNASSGGAGFAADVENWIPGAKAADDSWTKNIERIHALDDALAELLSAGRLEEAGAAYLKLWDAAEKVGLTVAQFKALFPAYNAALDRTSRSMFALGTATEVANKAGEALMETWNQVAGVMLTADQAMLEAKQAVKDVAEAFNSGTKTVKGNSQAALENRIALEEASKAANEAAEAYLKNGGTAEGAAAILRKFEEQAIAATGATGKQADEVRRLADQLFGIPSIVSTTIKIRVEETISVLAGQVSSLVKQALARFGLAYGGIVSYAAGGLERHVAQVGRPGAWRMWNEPEAGGEAYVPLALSKRGRSTAVLADVAQRFGYQLAPGGGGGGSIDTVALTRALASAFAAALDGATLTINDRTGTISNLLRRAG